MPSQFVDVEQLRDRIESFLRGPDRSVGRANEIETMMAQIQGADESFADAIVALASYRPEGGTFLYNEDTIVPILEASLRQLAETTSKR